MRKIYGGIKLIIYVPPTSRIAIVVSFSLRQELLRVSKFFMYSKLDVL